MPDWIRHLTTVALAGGRAGRLLLRLLLLLLAALVLGDDAHPGRLVALPGAGALALRAGAEVPAIHAEADEVEALGLRAEVQGRPARNQAILRHKVLQC